MSRIKDGSEITFDEISGYLEKEQVFSATTGIITISGSSETDFFLLKNPSGSGKNLLTQFISFGIDSAGNRSVIRGYAAPTITSNGTALTIVNNFVGSAVTTVMQAFSQPTISARGTLATTFIKGASLDSTFIKRSFLMAPNTNILVTVHNSQNNTPIYFSLQWIEVPV